MLEDGGSVNPQKKGPVKKFFKSFVDVKKWVSYDELKSNTKNTWGLFRRLFFSKRQEARRETYEEAIVRLELTPEQIVSRKNSFLYAAIIYGIFAIGFLCYLIYLLNQARFMAAILMLVLTSLMFLATYREHFWYMQMHKKKLGCNFSEWLAFVLRRK